MTQDAQTEPTIICSKHERALMLSALPPGLSSRSAPGAAWINGSLPDVNQTAEVKVCSSRQSFLSDYTGPCMYSSVAYVANCGGFFVYSIGSLSACSRLCTVAAALPAAQPPLPSPPSPPQQRPPPQAPPAAPPAPPSPLAPPRPSGFTASACAGPYTNVSDRFRRVTSTSGGLLATCDNDRFSLYNVYYPSSIAVTGNFFRREERPRVSFCEVQTCQATQSSVLLSTQAALARVTVPLRSRDVPPPAGSSTKASGTFRPRCLRQGRAADTAKVRPFRPVDYLSPVAWRLGCC